MKPTNSSEDCEFIDALQPFKGSLPVHQHLLFFFLLAAVFCSSCRFIPGEEIRPPAIRDEEPDERITAPVLDLHFKDCSRIFDDAIPRIARVDIFIYEDEELRTLETYKRIEGQTDCSVDISAGRKIIVALANVPGTFGLSSLRRMESLCQIEMDFNRDDPRSPVMSGILALEVRDSGKVCVELPLEPLMSRVIVERIDNSLGDYLTADSPVLSVTGAFCRLNVVGDKLAPSAPSSGAEYCNPSTEAGRDIGPDGCQLWQSIYYYPPADSLRLDFLVNGSVQSTSIALKETKSNTTEIVSLEIK